MTKRKPRHPGGIIQRQYLEPLNLSMKDLADILQVSESILSDIINEQTGITPDIALRLSIALQTTPDLWLNLQKNYDLWCAANCSDEWQKVTPIALKVS